MLIQNQPFAPHFGVWEITESVLPPMGRLVLGLHWTAEGGAWVGLMEWRILENADNLDEEVTFKVSDKDDEKSVHHAAWFYSFSQEFCAGGKERMLPAPMLWAECRFIIPVPLQLCEDCGGLRSDDDDCCE